MHPWRFINGVPSWLDAVLVSGYLLPGMWALSWGMALMDILEPKGSAYKLLGYAAYLGMLFGFCGLIFAMWVWNQKRIRMELRYPRLVWTTMTPLALVLLLPMAESMINGTSLGSSAQTLLAECVIILILSVSYLAMICLALLFPVRANTIAYYVAIGFAILCLAAKFWVVILRSKRN